MPTSSSRGLSPDQMEATLALYGWQRAGVSYIKELSPVRHALVNAATSKVLIFTGLPAVTRHSTRPLADLSVAHILDRVLEYENAVH